MEEIIAKSKAAKRQKAKEKEVDDDKLEELDDIFKTLTKARPRVMIPLIQHCSACWAPLFSRLICLRAH